jgi:ribose-phosphate pyrophosphokinase
MRELTINVDTNNEYFTFFKFHGGEVQIKLSLKDNNAIDQFIIFSRLADSDAIMRVLLTKNAIENYCRENDITCKHLFLVAPYLPYARQDRICSVGEAHSLKVVASLINNAKFDRVYVFDVHSDVSLALIDNVVNMSANTMIEKE